ncbi:MAG: hypothetical protein Kilf2KO_24790 [Rhodospirillales bacterium]
MSIFRPSVLDIISVMNKKAYRVFDTPDAPWNLNIVGIRNNPSSAKTFDDTIVVFHQIVGDWDVTYYPVTVDPSAKYLKKPVNSKGTAILKPGQYLSVYEINTHKQNQPGAHTALCQRLGEVTVYRDNNKNGELNFVNPESGFFGINIHRGPKNGDYDSDNDIYSAGCQVFADRDQFEEFMLKCEKGRAAFGNSFSYTLLEGTDF